MNSDTVLGEENILGKMEWSAVSETVESFNNMHGSIY